MSELFILPFDHRGSFQEKMFGILGEPTADEREKIKFFKEIIYNGFKIAIESGKVPKEGGAILVDEEFGDKIIRDAKQNGYKVSICCEKSGQEEFDFEFGENFKEHIEKYRPEYVKALIRYNPDGDQDLNERQTEKLKVLTDYCHENGYKLMLEPLVPPTERQLEILEGDKEAYDHEMRPQLMELMIEELQDGGVEPDIWKIEGLEEEDDYKMLVEQVQTQGRKSNIIILGRHAEENQVEKWLKIGAKVPGVVGFAVGRTIFWDALLEYKSGKITVDDAAKAIAERFEHFYKVFKEGNN